MPNGRARPARSRSRTVTLALAVGLATSVVAPTPAAGVQVSAAPAAGPGELHEEVASAFDLTQSYALLLPPGYGDEAAHPLLLVIHPRGRAVAALEVFRRPAARLGWIVVSSYDTRSDTADATVNERAIRAMLADAEEHLALDGRRIYVTGFSGTARVGWMLAGSLPDHVAGLVGVGAGFPSETVAEDPWLAPLREDARWGAALARIR